VSDPTAPHGFNVAATVPKRRHLSTVLRTLSNEALQFLLTASVHLLKATLPPEQQPSFGDIIANEALERQEQVLFTVVPDLLDHLRATFGPQSTVAYDERFELVRAVPLLILDDLGTESATQWAREKLYQLVNHRYNERLATVITTNLKPEAIEPRIYSRLCDAACGAIITIVGQDFRRRSQQSVGQNNVALESSQCS
jgi:hypothetical protein